MNFAIVDVETTGGNASRHKITEIAIYLHDGKKVIDTFHSLVNPERPVPPYITTLTGITNEMVAEAPSFAEISGDIDKITREAVFVAHNASFDYAFVKKEFNELGLPFQRKRLCTVRLSRKIFPYLPSYSLGNLCRSLKISLSDRHRAFGDAKATATLFTKLVDADEQDFIKYSLKITSKEQLLPPHIPRETFDQLPSGTGVYYFHDKQGKVVYVGKAKNIKKRIHSHFGGNTNTRTKQLFTENIWDVSYELTGSEFIAHLLELQEIRKHWPRYNKSLKSITLNYGIYQYTDRAGYERLNIHTAGKHDKPIVTFSSKFEATQQLLDKVKEHQLCLRLSGLLQSNEICSDKLEDKCPVCHNGESEKEYNSRLQKLITDWCTPDHNYIITDIGRTPDEISLAMTEKGRFLGFGFAPSDISISEPEACKDFLTGQYDDRASRQIIENFVLNREYKTLKGYRLYQSFTH